MRSEIVILLTFDSQFSYSNFYRIKFILTIVQVLAFNEVLFPFQLGFCMSTLFMALAQEIQQCYLSSSTSLRMRSSVSILA